jgi:glucosamine-phosphate N-acetyltransferase
MDSLKIPINIIIRDLDRSDLYSTSDFIAVLNELSETQQPSNSECNKLYNQYLNNNDHHVIVAEFNNVIVGAASIFIEHKFLHGGSRVGHVEDVVVTSKCRTAGVGNAMIKRLIEIAKDANCYKVILDCKENNIPFYIKCGFMPSQYCMRIDIN